VKASGLPSYPMTQSDSPPRLFDQIKQTCRFKHFSLKTEKSHSYYIRDYILFQNKRYLRDIGVDEFCQSRYSMSAGVIDICSRNPKYFGTTMVGVVRMKYTSTRFDSPGTSKLTRTSPNGAEILQTIVY
jgi:hypothetical protein